MRVVALSLAVLLGVVAVATAEQPWRYDATPGTFTVDTFEFTSVADMPWQDGTQVHVQMTGVAKKQITDGTLKFKLYESYVQHFESSGNIPYFKCDNKGCDPSEPITLFLEDPTADESKYTLAFDFQMGEAKKTGDFSLVLWGEDQNHTPYDFSVTVYYNYSMPTAALRGSVVAPEPSAPSMSGVPLPFSWNTTNGAMAITSVVATSSSNSWTAGAQVSIMMEGTIAHKHILAGTLKFKIYQSFVQYFIDEGNFPYFQCTNKGCNPANGIALHLDQPTAVPTKFSMNCTITVPRPISTGKNQFNLLLFGVDQDHYPVDFAVSMYYHLTDSAMQA